MVLLLPRRTHYLGLGTALFAALLLAGCANHPKPTPTTPLPTQVRSTPARHTTPAHATATATTSRVAKSAAPESTGIPACDDYLSSYVGCHMAAKIFTPGQLQDRYEAMRTSLLRDSQNPEIRPQLAARCNSLATQLRTALHGKSCQPTPAAASTSP